MRNYLVLYFLFASFLFLLLITQNAHGLRLFPAIQANEIIVSEYIRNDTVFVNPFNYSAATAFCENGDELTSGGYYLGFNSPGILEYMYTQLDQFSWKQIQVHEKVDKLVYQIIKMKP
jgi:hypothetical protein